MQQEQTVIDIHIANGGTGFIISRKVGKLVIVTESLSGVTGSDATGNIDFLTDNILPNPIHRLDIR